MLEVDKKREATASIRGYFYQLDAALLEILNAGLDDQVVIEGVEDFDRYAPDGIIYNQVKYYEVQSLTDSVLRDPLHKLFQHFHGLKEEERAGRRYVLYGHYKEVKIALAPLTGDRFKEVMTYFKVEEDKSRTKKSHLDGLSIADDLIEAFCSVFEIRPAKEFAVQRAEVVAQLRSNQKVTEIEALGFHYPRAFDFVATLATRKDHVDRSTSLRKLQDHLKGTQAVHHSWLLRENDAAAYGRFMRDLYFSQQNTAGVIRVFILEVDKNTGGEVIADQVQEIAKKWSSAGSPRTPNNERHAPFVILRNAAEDLIQQVKNLIHEEGVEFVDGHPYRGSPFRAEHVQTPQTKERAVAVRFVDNLDQLTAALDGMGRNPRRIYDFFTSVPMPLNQVDANFRGFSIPIDDLSCIKNIV